MQNDEQPDLADELDFDRAITPGNVQALINEQSVLMQRIVTTSGPACVDMLTKLHDRVDLAVIALERGGFDAQSRGLVKLALAFLAKQVFIDVWRVSHKAQLAGHQTHGKGKKQTKKKGRQ